MNPTTLKFLLLIAFLLSGCDISVIAENNVFIKRIPSNDFIKVIFFEPSVFGDNRIYEGKVISQNNGFDDIIIKLRYPKVYEFAPQNSIFNPIYVTPGDSVTYCVKRDESKNGERDIYYLEFSGKNAAHYNYGTLLNKKLGWSFFFKQGDSLEEYKQTTSAQYSAHMNFLSDYIKKHSVSDGFIHWAEADIKNEYVFRLFLPLSLGYATMGDVSENYFSDIKIVANDLSKYYALATKSYIQLYTADIFSNFSKIYADFIHNESGKNRAYLLSSAIGIFAEKQNRIYFNELLQAIKGVSEYVSDSMYLDYINRSKKFYLSIDEQFPDSVLMNSFLISYDKNEKISLKEVLEMYKDKALYLDFWASWCAPCRKDISNSQETKKYLSENQIEYLYISIDNNENDWRNASKKDKIGQNQFLLYDSKNSPLTCYLEMKYIPRYLLFNREHRIKDFAAPSPSIENFNVLKESIKMNLESNEILK